MLSALKATIFDGHYDRCLYGMRGSRVAPDDTRCSDICVQVRAAIAAGEGKSEGCGGEGPARHPDGDRGTRGVTLHAQRSAMAVPCRIKTPAGIESGQPSLMPSFVPGLPETWAANPPHVFPPLPDEAYRERYYHECQCPEHDCTIAVPCSEIEPCGPEAHTCQQCSDGSYVCAVVGEGA
jgi:hypothetical protein